MKKTEQLFRFLFLSLNYFINEMKKITIFYFVLIILNLIGFFVTWSVTNLISLFIILSCYIVIRYDIRIYHIGILEKSVHRINFLDTFISTPCADFRKIYLAGRYSEITLNLIRSDCARVTYGLTPNSSILEYPLKFNVTLIFSPVSFKKQIYPSGLGRPEFLKETRKKLFIHDKFLDKEKYGVKCGYLGTYRNNELKNLGLHYNVSFETEIASTVFPEGNKKFTQYLEELLKTGDFDNEFNYIRNRYNRSREVWENKK